MNKEQPLQQAKCGNWPLVLQTHHLIHSELRLTVRPETLKPLLIRKHSVSSKTLFGIDFSGCDIKSKKNKQVDCIKLKSFCNKGK